MDSYVDKYKKMIEDELFKATFDETIEFCQKLVAYLDEVREQAEKERLYY